MSKETSSIKEVVAAWQNIQQFLRGGDEGKLVPVVIPKDNRGFGGYGLLAFSLYLLLAGLFAANIFGVLLIIIGLGAGGVAVAWLYNSIVIRIEQGTTGILSRYGKIVGILPPGRRFLFKPWEKVEFIVDTSTEIPYTAPVQASPTQENVPLKSIEFFLKFRIVDPVKFVRHIGASNFDIVLSSAVQDAIRQRSRLVQTEKAYDLRGSDVGDMQVLLNRQLERYGVRIVGANIPDVQLPDQYQQNLATRERVAKELVAYEKEWELIKKQRTDTILLEIERAKKIQDAKKIEVKEAINKAREDVAQMLQERETEAEKIRLEIEAKGQATLKAAENEARALNRLGKSYQDNWAVLQYELALHRLQVAEVLASEAPRPVLVHSEGNGDSSALSMLMMAQLLPQMMGQQQRQSLPQPPPPPTFSQAVGQTAVDSGLLDDVRDLADNVRSKVRSAKRGNS
ncbi:MAG: SPFH domain-containing protein [Ardenticatenaceae bacterium]|nr:SPFH domain-containing protein [Ardenticatenaceae bacterium]